MRASCILKKILEIYTEHSSNVSTNVGGKNLKILDKCFPAEHQLHNLLNRNTVKISYRCMPNMKNIINNHNNMIIKNNRTNPPTPAAYKTHAP